MFVRLAGKLPPDPVFPSTLREHGYSINPDNLIRSIDNPEEGVKVRVSKNERYNSMRSESFHNIVMDEVTKRMEEIGIHKFYLPQMTTVKPDEPCVPIFVSDPAQLKSKERVVVLVPQSSGELEILSFPGMFDAEGIEEASPLAIARQLRDEASPPGLVILNPTQFLYSYIHNRALSISGWYNRPRPSMLHSAHVILPNKNMIEGHGSAEEHTIWVFDNLLSNPDFVNPSAKLDILAIREGGASVIQYLNTHFDQYASRISSMALVHSFYDASTVDNLKFRTFLSDRARSWVWAEEPVNTPIVDPLATVNLGTLCPTLSGGDFNNPDLLIIRSRKAILEWLKMAYDSPEFINPEFTVIETKEDGTTEVKTLEITDYCPGIESGAVENKWVTKKAVKEYKEEYGTCDKCGEHHRLTDASLPENANWREMSRGSYRW